MAQTYQQTDDFDVIQRMERLRKLKTFLVFAAFVAVAIGAAVFMQIAETGVMPYGQ